MNEKLREKFEEFLELLENDADMIEYKEAKECYKNDEDVITKINEYNVQTSLLDQEKNKAEKDSLLVENLKKRLKELYTEISESKTMVRMSAAEDKVTAIFSEINMGLQKIVNPEASEGGCSGSCSSCGGCH